MTMKQDVAGALLLLIPYYIGFHEEGIELLLEDMAELVAISGFASTMAYFQQRLLRLMNQYRDDSRTDYLPQLGNRLAYTRAVKEIDTLAVDRRKTLALLLMDMDNFKRINDLYGHRCWDLLLREFARRLERLGAGRAFRIGGDEFALLVDETLGMDARQAANRSLICSG
ncbi:MAG: GGDEF domain-containing protein [Desulfobacter sp.]|nr:MAG: GGDEF domain-containing protein [Desulfobacter sp.]